MKQKYCLPRRSRISLISAFAGGDLMALTELLDVGIASIVYNRNDLKKTI